MKATKETSSKEQSLTDVLTIQSQYDFLGHNKQRTPEERKKQFEGIQKKVDKFASRMVVYFCIGIMAASLLTSCNKNRDFDTPSAPQEPQKEYVTQNIRLTNFDITQMNAKSWDINTWTWLWNPLTYNLTFTSKSNPLENVVKPVTIAQL